MHVCLSTCMCACTCVNVNMGMCVCKYACMYMCACASVCMHVHEYECMHGCPCICSCLCNCACTCICTFACWCVCGKIIDNSQSNDLRELNYSGFIAFYNTYRTSIIITIIKEFFVRLFLWTNIQFKVSFRQIMLFEIV